MQPTVSAVHTAAAHWHRPLATLELWRKKRGCQCLRILSPTVAVPGIWSRANVSPLGANVTVSVVSVGLTYNLYHLVKPSCYDIYIMLRF